MTHDTENFKAHDYFIASLENATILMNAREELSGERTVDHGERRAFSMSSLLWIVTAWESYVEELAVELATELATQANTFQELPPLLQRSVCKFVENSGNQLAAGWLSGDGWRMVVVEHAKRQAGVHDATSSEFEGAKSFGFFNTPDASNIDNLFEHACGLKDLSAQWNWRKRNAESAANELQTLIRVRGEIAHGYTPEGIGKNWLKTYSGFVLKLVEKTERAAQNHLESGLSSTQDLRAA